MRSSSTGGIRPSLLLLLHFFTASQAWLLDLAREDPGTPPRCVLWASLTTTVSQSVHLTVRQRSVVEPSPATCHNTGRACLYFKPFTSPHLTPSHLSLPHEFPGVSVHKMLWLRMGSSSVQFSGTLSGTWENLSKKNFQTLVNFQQRCEDQHNLLFLKKRQ